MTKLKRVNNIYHTICFIAQSIIPLIDELIDTDDPKRQLKKALKDTLTECEKATKKHYNSFVDVKEINEHSMLDIHNTTAKAYDLLFTLKPNELVSLIELYKQSKKDNINLNEVGINYEPLLK